MQEEISFQFKILVLGEDAGIRLAWDALQPESFELNDDLVTGVRFGTKTYEIPDARNKIITKVLLCSFSPKNILPTLRKGYLRGANGVLGSILTTDSKNVWNSTIHELLEVNRDSLPIIGFIISGEPKKCSRWGAWVNQHIKKVADALGLGESILEVGQLMNQVVLAPDGERTAFEAVITAQIRNILKKFR